ncbi:lasso RiPP family leader peptide-containing protein [Amycolatopsis sp. H20-H5]|nr:lasso RiPP family leader peptide-containing protein [Amycolatopsis sp. H20-H5]MEC3975570.1 lasso RiPP family leader peptide-containing protein [Amycolatopsis sp. H20-H5]
MENSENVELNDVSAPYEQPMIARVGGFAELTRGFGGLAHEVYGLFGPNP